MSMRLHQWLFGTLRGRLIVGVALVHAVMMLLFLWDLTVRQQDLIRARQLDQATALSQTLAVSSAGWVAAKDLAGLQELVDAQKRYPGLEFAMLLATDGRVLAHSDCSKQGFYLHDLPPEPRQTVLQRSAQLVEVITPVQLAQQQLGWARVGIGQNEAARKLAAVTRDGLCYTLAAILIGSLMAWLVGRTVTRRLYIMQEVINQVKAGDHQARIALAGSDEAARLSAEFNQMLDHLEQRAAERDRAEDLLQKSEEFLRNIVENIPAMIFVKDAGELRFVSLNRAAEELLGISREEMIGKNDYDFFPKAQADHFSSRDRAVLEMQGGIDVQEEEIQTRDGLKTLRTKKIAILDRKGNPCYLLGISIDITLQKQREQALLEAKETAEATCRSKSQFLNMLSHELRTPLNGLLGGLQLLEFTSLDEEQREYLSMVTSSADRELALINGLLSLTAIEAGALPVSNAPFALRDLLGDVIMRQQPAAAAKGLALVLQVDAVLPEQLVGDAPKIGQAVELLLENALKFTEQGQVTVSVGQPACDGGSCRLAITVADTGIGIAPALLERVFEPFTQADMSDTRCFGGTGMGLTICRRLLEAMGGTVRVESEPGQGSRFVVVLVLDLPDACSCF